MEKNVPCWNCLCKYTLKTLVSAICCPHYWGPGCPLHSHLERSSYAAQQFDEALSHDILENDSTNVLVGRSNFLPHCLCSDSNSV